MDVTDYLDRARECAALADRKTGEEKKRLESLAEAWLQLASEAADKALPPAPPANASGASSTH
jgi:hypothetical protein